MIACARDPQPRVLFTPAVKLSKITRAFATSACDQVLRTSRARSRRPFPEERLSRTVLPKELFNPDKNNRRDRFRPVPGATTFSAVVRDDEGYLYPGPRGVSI